MHCIVSVLAVICLIHGVEIDLVIGMLCEKALDVFVCKQLIMGET